MKTRKALLFISSLLFASMAFVLSPSTAIAGEKECDPKKEACICHNIGGPNELGANCDATGCEFETDIGTVRVPVGHFLGIIIGFNQDSNALAAHIAHGDGPIVTTYDPPLHLASEGLNHRASNVECLGRRLIADPGN